MIPKQAQNLPWRAIGDRCVVINPGRGEVHELDEVGSFLWQAADGSRSVEKICDELVTRFEFESAQELPQVLEDAQGFFAQLESLGLLTCQS